MALWLIARSYGRSHLYISARAPHGLPELHITTYYDAHYLLPIFSDQGCGMPVSAMDVCACATPYLYL